MNPLQPSATADPETTARANCYVSLFRKTRDLFAVHGLNGLLIHDVENDGGDTVESNLIGARGVVLLTARQVIGPGNPVIVTANSQAREQLDSNEVHYVKADSLPRTLSDFATT